MSTATLRQQDPSVFRRLLAEQDARCAVCGRSYQGKYEFHLDHIVPWRLGGNAIWNLQLLCSDCNRGKRDTISAMQYPAYHNWCYGDTAPLKSATLQTRYVRLAMSAECSTPGCSSGPREQELRVARRLESGLWVLDNLRVLCGAH